MEKHQPKDASELKGKTGLRRLMNAAKYSAQGSGGLGRQKRLSAKRRFWLASCCLSRFFFR